MEYLWIATIIGQGGKNSLTAQMQPVCRPGRARRVELQPQHDQAIEKARVLPVTLVPVSRLRNSEVAVSSGEPQSQPPQSLTIAAAASHQFTRSDIILVGICQVLKRAGNP